jgi:hypothetical protein
MSGHPPPRRGPTLGLALLLALLLATAGCWSTDLARDTSWASPPQRPRPGETDAEPWVPVGMPDRAPAGGPAGAPQLSTEAELTILPGPVAVNVRRDPPPTPLLADRAVLRIDLPVGFRHGQSGLAELLALTVAECADAAGNQPALRPMLAGLGGELEVQVGAAWTSYTVTVPADVWPAALRSLAMRIQRVPLDRVGFAALQDRMIRRHLADWRRAPLLGYVAQWLQHGARTRQRIIEDIADRGMLELAIFQRRH